MQSKMIHLTRDGLPTYMQFPKFLLETNLSYTAMIIYMVLLDRARLSLKHGWTNEEGITYLVYPIEDLAKAVHRIAELFDGIVGILDNRIITGFVFVARTAFKKLLCNGNSRCGTENGTD